MLEFPVNSVQEIGMTTPQFDSREEFETFLNDPERINARSASNKRSIALWRIIPVILFAFSFGVSALFLFNKQEPNNKAQTERAESVLSWLGLDVDKFRREHEERMENIRGVDYDFEYETPDWLAN